MLYRSLSLLLIVVAAILASVGCEAAEPTSPEADMQTMVNKLEGGDGIEYSFTINCLYSTLKANAYFSGTAVIERTGRFAAHLLTSKADRIDILGDGAGLIVYDHKAARYSEDYSEKTRMDLVDALMGEFDSFFSKEPDVVPDIRATMDLPAIYFGGNFDIGHGTESSNWSEIAGVIRGRRARIITERISSSTVNELVIWTVDSATELPLSREEQDWDPDGAWLNFTHQDLSNVHMLAAPMPQATYRFRAPASAAKLVLKQTGEIQTN